MFLSTVFKAEADVLHLWHGRRASTRMRSELMAAIYAKALVRKDYSGITDKKEENKAGESLPASKKESKKAKKEEKRRRKEEETKNTAGANVGKIVNLMSGDANRVAMMVGGAYFIYVGRC